MPDPLRSRLAIQSDTCMAQQSLTVLTQFHKVEILLFATDVIASERRKLLGNSTRVHAALHAGQARLGNVLQSTPSGFLHEFMKIRSCVELRQLVMIKVLRLSLKERLYLSPQGYAISVVVWMRLCKRLE